MEIFLEVEWLLGREDIYLWNALFQIPIGQWKNNILGQILAIIDIYKIEEFCKYKQREKRYYINCGLDKENLPPNDQLNGTCSQR